MLRVQTQLMMAMRADLHSLSDKRQATTESVFRQSEALGEMVLALNNLQPTVMRLEGHVASMGQRLDRMEKRQATSDQWQDKTGARLDGLDQRFDRMEQRQDRMDGNIEAIMRHLGVEADPA